jgi:hypothetical protein
MAIKNNAKPILLGLTIGLLCGYFLGREHLLAEIRYWRKWRKEKYRSRMSANPDTGKVNESSEGI